MIEIDYDPERRRAQEAAQERRARLLAEILHAQRLADAASSRLQTQAQYDEHQWRYGTRP